MMAPPPGRFSTTTDCPQDSVSFLAMTRANRSDPPPGVTGTMMRTVLLGYSCAHAACIPPGIARAEEIRQTAVELTYPTLCTLPVTPRQKSAAGFRPLARA